MNLTTCEYNMRRKCDFHVLSYNTSHFKRGVINMGIGLYNNKYGHWVVQQDANWNKVIGQF
jgi:hypothetical protein